MTTGKRSRPGEATGAAEESTAQPSGNLLDNTARQLGMEPLFFTDGELRYGNKGIINLCVIEHLQEMGRRLRGDRA